MKSIAKIALGTVSIKMLRAGPLPLPSSIRPFWRPINDPDKKPPP